MRIIVVDISINKMTVLCMLRTNCHVAIFIRMRKSQDSSCPLLFVLEETIYAVLD